MTRYFILAAVGAPALAWLLYSVYVIGRIAVANYELVTSFAGWAP
jgi:hypothetical protein